MGQALPDPEEQAAERLNSLRRPALSWPDFPVGKPATPELRRRTEGYRNRWSARSISLLLALPALVREEAEYGRSFLAVTFLIGAGAAIWLSVTQEPLAWLPWAWMPLVGLLWLAARSGRRRLGGALALVMLLSIGMGLAALQSWRASTIIIDTPVTTRLTGIVERRDSDGEGRWRYVLRITQTRDPVLQRPPERVNLLVRSRHDAFLSGTEITALARLSPPSGPALLGLNDFAFSAYFEGIGAVGYAYGRPQATGRTDDGAGANLTRWLFSLRSAVGDRIRSIVPGDAGAFAAALVTDERRAISPETVEALRLSGLAHIVAISGLNMALAAGIFFIGVRSALGLFPGFAQTYPIKKIAAVGALLMVTAYYMISGFGVSAERAYIMMAVSLTAVLFDKPLISLRNVALSALVIMVSAPSAVLGPSFEMSFAATAALVASYTAWSDWMSQRRLGRKPPRNSSLAMLPARLLATLVISDFTTSIVGGLSTAIFSVEHFHRVTTYGLVANVAAMPPITFVVMPAAVAGMLLMPFGLDAPFLKIMGWGLDLVIMIAETVASWGGDVAVGRQHPWFLPLGACGLLLLCLLRTRLRLIGVPLLTAAIVLACTATQTQLPDLLIAEDGTLVALPGVEAVATNRSTPPKFIYEQWQHALMLARASPPVMASVARSAPKPADDDEEEEGGAAPASRSAKKKTEIDIRSTKTRLRKLASQGDVQTFQCLRGIACFARTKEGILLATVEDARFVGTACDLADMVIAPRASFPSCRSGALLISGNALRRTGALEVSFNGSTDAAKWRATPAMLGADRPWSVHRAYDWRTRTFDKAVPPQVLSLVSGSGG